MLFDRIYWVPGVISSYWRINRLRLNRSPEKAFLKGDYFTYFLDVICQFVKIMDVCGGLQVIISKGLRFKSIKIRNISKLLKNYNSFITSYILKYKSFIQIDAVTSHMIRTIKSMIIFFTFIPNLGLTRIVCYIKIYKYE